MPPETVPPTEPGPVTVTAAPDADCHTLPNGECVSGKDCMHAPVDATVACECCETPLPPGTPAKIDRATGVIICLPCFSDLEPLS